MIRDRARCVSTGWQGPTTREASSCQTSSPSRRSTPTGPFRRPPRRPARRAPTSSSAAGSPVPASWPAACCSRAALARRGRDLDPQAFEEERHQDRQLRAHARVPRGRVLQAGGRQRRDHEARPAGIHQRRRRARGGARQGAQGPRLERGQEAEVRLRRHGHEPGQVPPTAQVLEDTGVAAYAGQGPNLLQRPLVVAALSIHSVEARHAAWIRFLNYGGGGGTGTPPTTRRRGRSTRRRARRRSSAPSRRRQGLAGLQQQPGWP